MLSNLEGRLVLAFPGCLCPVLNLLAVVLNNAANDFLQRQTGSVEAVWLMTSGAGLLLSVAEAFVWTGGISGFLSLLSDSRCIVLNHGFSVFMDGLIYKK